MFSDMKQNLHKNRTYLHRSRKIKTSYKRYKRQMAEKVLTVCGIHMHTHCMFYIKIHICLRGQQQTL